MTGTWQRPPVKLFCNVAREVGWIYADTSTAFLFAYIRIWFVWRKQNLYIVPEHFQKQLSGKLVIMGCVSALWVHEKGNQQDLGGSRSLQRPGSVLYLTQTKSIVIPSRVSWEDLKKRSQCWEVLQTDGCQLFTFNCEKVQVTINYLIPINNTLINSPHFENWTKIDKSWTLWTCIIFLHGMFVVAVPQPATRKLWHSTMGSF